MLTIEELHRNEELRQHEFPICGKEVFLSHAGVSPFPRRVAEAMSRYALDSMTANQEDIVMGPFLDETRAAAARLIGANPSEIALVGPTSLALSYVAAGLPWRRGHNVLIYHDCYPSNVYPWMALADRGVEVRLMNIRELGKVRMLDVQGQVDENTKLVALASCHYLTGWRLNHSALGKWLHSRNILFCLDGIQTLGAFPTRVDHVDFLAADAHKWLLGPGAAGILYVRQEHQERLKPIVHGWHNVRSPDLVTQPEIRYRPDARRYEVGSPYLAGLFGMKAGLELIEEVGVEAIATDLASKRAWLVDRLAGRGWNVVQPQTPPENTGGIVSFHAGDVELPAFHAKLKARGIFVALRTLPGGQKVLRASPHFYNTSAELERFVEELGTPGQPA